MLQYYNKTNASTDEDLYHMQTQVVVSFAGLMFVDNPDLC